MSIRDATCPPATQLVSSHWHACWAMLVTCGCKQCRVALQGFEDGLYFLLFGNAQAEGQASSGIPLLCPNPCINSQPGAV